MKNIWVLTKRECLAYFYTPLAYVVMTAFLFFTGLVFSQVLSNHPDTDVMGDILGFVSFILLIITPMITMRLLADEKRTGTLEMLMTAPVRETEIVAAKFLGGWLFYCVLIIPTFVYAILLVKWGNPDIGALITGYIGLILLGTVLVAIGLFISSLTANQIVAAIVTFLVFMVIGWLLAWNVVAPQFSQWVIGLWNGTIGHLVGNADYLVRPLADIFRYLGLLTHLESFQKGLVDTRDVVFFLSLTVLCLFLTVRMLEAKRWK